MESALLCALSLCARSRRPSHLWLLCYLSAPLCALSRVAHGIFPRNALAGRPVKHMNDRSLGVLWTEASTEAPRLRLALWASASCASSVQKQFCTNGTGNQSRSVLFEVGFLRLQRTRHILVVNIVSGCGPALKRNQTEKPLQGCAVRRRAQLSRPWHSFSLTERCHPADNQVDLLPQFLPNRQRLHLAKQSTKKCSDGLTTT